MHISTSHRLLSATVYVNTQRHADKHTSSIVVKKSPSSSKPPSFGNCVTRSAATLLPHLPTLIVLTFGGATVYTSGSLFVCVCVCVCMYTFVWGDAECSWQLLYFEVLCVCSVVIVCVLCGDLPSFLTPFHLFSPSPSFSLSLPLPPSLPLSLPPSLSLSLSLSLPPSLSLFAGFHLSK